MMFSYACKVDIGRYEESNDDRVLAGSVIVMDGNFSGRECGEHFISAVCDGVGGMAKGYLAAMTSLEVLSHLNRDGVNENDIRASIEEANMQVRKLQTAEGLPDGMRTTVAGIYADAQRFIVFNAGDSRVYRFRYKYLTLLSKDHSLVQDMIDIGELSQEQAKTHPKKNIINKCLGHEEVVNPRVIDLSDDLTDGDIIMICSDGISDEISENDLKEVLFEHRQDADLSECCEAICEKAADAGSKDNMSVILIRKEAENYE